MYGNTATNSYINENNGNGHMKSRVNEWEEFYSDLCAYFMLVAVTLFTDYAKNSRQQQIEEILLYETVRAEKFQFFFVVFILPGLCHFKATNSNLFYVI